MSAPHEIPSFAVDAHDSPDFQTALPGDAALIWHDTPGVYAWGNQENYRLWTATHPLGRVALIGACFTDQDTLDDKLADALEQERPELLTYLPGSYVTILHERDKLTVMRDVAGVFPVYFTDEAEGTVVSSSPNVAVDGASLRPNIAQAIANLTFVAPNEGGLGGEVSCFEGLSKLMGGQALTIDRQGRQSVYAYEPLLSNPRHTRASAAAELRTALREAVQSRIASGVPVSANLSGGVDSSSIVSLALEAMSPDQSLPVFFMDNPGQETIDKKLFAEYVAQDPRLEPNLFDMRTLPHDLGGIPISSQELGRLTHPARQAFLLTYYSEVLKTGAGQLHLTGNGGDEVVAVGPYYLPDLLRKGHVKRFIKEGREWARIYNTSPYKMWSAMGRLAFRGVEGALRNAAERVDDDSREYTGDPIESLAFWQPDKTALRWLTPEARRILAEYLTERAQAIDIPKAYGVGNFIARERMRAAGSDQGLEMYNVPAGISLHSPFLDHNVVRAASAADATLKGSPYEFKLLIREALNGIAPEYILNRPSKGVYGPTSRERHFEALRTLDSLLDDSVLVKLGIIDPHPIRKELRRLEMVPPSTMWALTQVLITERWLRSLNISTTLDSVVERDAQLTHATGDKQHDGSMLKMTDNITVPSYIYFVSAADGSLLAFNQKTDQYHPLTPTQSNTLRLLAYTGSVQQTFDQMSSLYPQISRETLVSDTTDIIKTFYDLGIVASNGDSEPRLLPVEQAPRFISGEFHTAHVDEDTRSKRINRSLATVALMGTEIVGRFMPHKRKDLLDSLQKWATRPASQSEARDVLSAVQSSKYVGRIACLQASYAAAVALALKGEKVDWHIGASFAPLDIHAWIEAEGEPVRTSKDGRVMGSYQSFFSNATT